MLRVTTRHKESKFGVPVIIDGNKRMDYPLGVARVCETLGWTRKDFAERTGYKIRSVHEIFAGDMKISAAALNVLRDSLEDHYAKIRKKPQKTIDERGKTRIKTT